MRALATLVVSSSERGLPPQLDHPPPELVLSLQRLIDLLPLAVPAFHREVELRCLKAREREIGSHAAFAQSMHALGQPAPGTGENRNLGGDAGPGTFHCLLLKLLGEGFAFVTDSG